MTNKPRRNRSQVYARLVTPFGSPVTMSRAKAQRYLEADLALFERLDEVGSAPAWRPYIEG